jgi:amino acid permease
MKLWKFCSRGQKNKRYSIFTGYFYFVNFLIGGTGVLNLPYIFYNAGIVSATLTLFFVSVISCCTAMWIVESEARAQVRRDMHV